MSSSFQEYFDYFANPIYLKSGNAIQQKAYQALENIKFHETLKEYDAFLAGTIPLDLDIEGSDLDIICYAKDFSTFLDQVNKAYGNHLNYEAYETLSRGLDSLVVRFKEKNFDIEIFCQKIPVDEQYAVLHMIAEARILDLAGEKARQDIRALKMKGFKTEPAFAKYFQFQDDPYDELACLALLRDEEIREQIPMLSN